MDSAAPPERASAVCFGVTLSLASGDLSFADGTELLAVEFVAVEFVGFDGRLTRILKSQCPSTFPAHRRSLEFF